MDARLFQDRTFQTGEDRSFHTGEDRSFHTGEGRTFQNREERMLENDEMPSQDSSVVSAHPSLVYTTDSSLYATSTLYTPSFPLDTPHQPDSEAKNSLAAAQPVPQGDNTEEDSQTQNETKDNLVNEMVKQKLLMLESNDETRL